MEQGALEYCDLSNPLPHGGHPSTTAKALRGRYSSHLAAGEERMNDIDDQEVAAALPEVESNSERTRGTSATS